ncbi:nucleoside-diphosphate-sugar epimerase [Stackebrandtia endophytica]|uniref:Nucleoside-diphosphate-sugar epimerase n=1 Tax=Stackebrandtia endophytica TaxID=1496996 RepID=A0A543B0N2_9ACTN|nr:nucleoside-diphosphate-sugar epimerase [Stackebrandtia endophytica]
MKVRPVTHHVILGKGQIGSTVAESLARRGDTVRVLSRSGGTDTDSITHHKVDARDRDALLAACRGADVIYNCANPGGYHQWEAEWPPMAEALLAAAEANDAGLVMTGNLYVYAETDRHMTERSALAATTRKGRLRVEMWEEAVARHRAGRLRVTEARASDFFGPGTTQNAMLGERVMRPLLAGGNVQLLGDVDAPHSFTYIPDVANALIRLADDDRSWGRAWHIPTAPAVSQRDMVDGICEIAGRSPARITRMPWWLIINVAGLFQPHLRGLAETRHQWDSPYVMESTEFTETFGDVPTPFDEALGETVEWWRRRIAEQR